MEAESSFIGYAVLIVVIISAVSVPILDFILQQKKIKELQRRGTRITAVVTRVEKSTTNNSVIGGLTFPDTSYKIYAIWRNPLTEKVDIFTSRWRLSEFQELSEGSHVSILIDPDNPSRYNMEL